MGNTVLLICLRRGHFVIALKFQLLVDDRKDRVPTPIRRIDLAATRTQAASPLVRENDFRSVIIKGCGVPIREVLLPDRIEADRMNGIRDVEQNSVPRARTRRESNLRINSDVMTLICFV